MMHTLIIGGGAAGMAAAIAAARAGQTVTVLERGRRPLKKLGGYGQRAGQPAQCRRAGLSRRGGFCRAGACRYAL